MEAAGRLLTRDAVVFGLMATILAVSLAVQLPSMAIPDIAWYLHSGERFLDGGVLYRDVFLEVNPPLGFFLTLPAVILARLAGLFPVHVFVVYIHIWVVLSLSAVWWLLRSDRRIPPIARRGLLVLGAVVLVVCPGNQFGQREHLMILLALPYLLLIARRAHDSRTPWLAAFGIGLAAGAGFAIKPHFLLVPLALEVYRLAMTRHLSGIVRAEILGLGAALAGYAAVLLLVTPDYLTRILPYVLEVYNQAYRNPLWINLLRVETLALPLVVLAHLATRRGQAAPHTGDVFTIASGCLFLAYLVQMKGWDYHLYPASACLMLGAAGLFLNAFEPRPKHAAPAGKAGPARALAVASLALIAVLVGSDVSKFGYTNRFTEIMTPHVARYAAGGSIAIFGSNVWPGFPLVNNTGVGWSSRFPALWLLPGAVRKRHGGEAANTALLDEMEAFTRDSVVADFAKDMPDLVIVDDREEKSYFGGIAFDYLEYFSRDPRFARMWSDYVWVAEVVDFDLYRRRCAPNC